MKTKQHKGIEKKVSVANRSSVTSNYKDWITVFCLFLFEEPKQPLCDIDEHFLKFLATSCVLTNTASTTKWRRAE